MPTELACVCERIFYTKFYTQALMSPAIYSHFEMFAKLKKEKKFRSFQVAYENAKGSAYFTWKYRI